jgi:hypothetical protein
MMNLRTLLEKTPTPVSCATAALPTRRKRTPAANGMPPLQPSCPISSNYR